MNASWPGYPALPVGSFVDAYGVRMAGQFLVNRPEDGQSCSCLSSISAPLLHSFLSQFQLVWAAANSAAIPCWAAFGVEAMLLLFL